MLPETARAPVTRRTNWSHIMSLDRLLNSYGHVHRFVVTSDLTGWEVREEEDSAILRRVHREDWHRVERDIQLFEIRAMALKGQGWMET
jgi:hypothetical protein